MSSTPLLVACLVSNLFLAGGCADEAPGTDAGSPMATARDRLVAGPRILGLTADEALIALDVSIRRPDRWVVYPTILELRHGSLTVSARPDGTVQMTAASLFFEDLAVGDKGVPPTGLHLTDIEIHTRAAHECEWVTWAADGDACSASIPAAFYLDWSMVATDGVVYPLGTQALEPIDLWIDVAGDGRHLESNLDAVQSGRLWSWAGVVEFGNLEMALSARELIPLAAD